MNAYEVVSETLERGGNFHGFECYKNTNPLC